MISEVGYLHFFKCWYHSHISASCQINFPYGTSDLPPSIYIYLAQQITAACYVNIYWDCYVFYCWLYLCAGVLDYSVDPNSIVLREYTLIRIWSEGSGVGGLRSIVMRMNKIIIKRLWYGENIDESTYFRELAGFVTYLPFQAESFEKFPVLVNLHRVWESNWVRCLLI